MKLTFSQIKYFIENYGDGDIYFSHEDARDGKIAVKYFPKITKFVDEENVYIFKDEVRKDYYMQQKYLRTIILTPAYAYIPELKDKAKTDKLVINYSKFLQSIKDPHFQK